MKTPAVAYMRTSSAANVGDDKDSQQRQALAIESFAKTAGFELKEFPDRFYDKAVSGADPVNTRPGFSELLAYLSANEDVKTIIVETASRFARDLIIQETGFSLLQELGIELVAVDSPDSFLEDGPTAVLIRQVLGAVAQFDKSMTVAKLKGARDRKRALTGKCEGRKSHQEARPDLVARAKILYRKPRNGNRRSLRAIAAQLETEGFTGRTGKQFGPSQIKSMIS